MANPRSTAQVAGHPIHPMLVPFPIAFFVATFACDLAFLFTGNPLWVLASQWLLGAGLVMAILAAIMGLIDVAGDQQIRNIRAAWLHAGGNTVAVLIALSNFYLRLTSGTEIVIPAGFILSLVVVALLLYTGWKGWELVYQHHVGVVDRVAAETDDGRSKSEADGTVL